MKTENMGEQSEPLPLSSKMDIDNPGLLKRSNSAPMIPQLNNVTPSTVRSPSNNNILLSNSNVDANRTRRFSVSCTPRSLTSSPKTLARIEQIRQEECVHASNREAAHENKIHNAMRISQSWEDLTIMVDSPNKSDDECKRTTTRMKDGVLDPLNLHLSSFSLTQCSPSPTMGNSNYYSRQWHSPGLFKINSSPSPTRKTFATTHRRSLSPIPLRPSCLGSVKRKFDFYDNEPPAKRTGGGLLVIQSRLEPSVSPLPNSSVSSVGTPESISSVDSPCSFTFAASDSPLGDHPMRDISKIDQNIA